MTKTAQVYNAEKPGFSNRALWSLGFRPFYLLASAYAACAVLLWAGYFAGLLPAANFPNALWHGHEMLFGYTVAVITGFLFTAVRNWTGQATPEGKALAALAMLWLAGRILLLTPYGVASALVNAAFPLAVAAAIARPLWLSGNRRNYFFVVLLIALSVASLLLHLAQLGWVEWPARLSLRVGLDLVAFIMAVVGGRVIPMFSNNGIPGLKAVRQPRLEKAALGSVLLLLVADLLQLPAPYIAGIAACAALTNFWRLCLWQPWRVLVAPMVWVLHMAYAWIAFHFTLRSLAAFGLVGEAMAVHALTIGAIGGMTLGMMTRTARGHSGLEIAAGRAELACFILVQAAALTRVFGGLFLTAHYITTVWVAASLWSIAFAIFFVRYWTILTRPRQ